MPRNQLIHGGAIWGGGTNRAQMKGGAAVLGTVVPLILELMLCGDVEGFVATAFPVV